MEKSSHENSLNEFKAFIDRSIEIDSFSIHDKNFLENTVNKRVSMPISFIGEWLDEVSLLRFCPFIPLLHALKVCFDVINGIVATFR